MVNMELPGISAGSEAAQRKLQLLHEHDPSLCTYVVERLHERMSIARSPCDPELPSRA
jgi:hypothetical protein